MAAIVAAFSIVAIVFMAVFFVKLCAEGSRVKVYEVLQLDTDTCAQPVVGSHSASKVVVITGTSHDSNKNKRSRKPA